MLSEAKQVVNPKLQELAQCSGFNKRAGGGGGRGNYHYIYIYTAFCLPNSNYNQIVCLHFQGGGGGRFGGGGSRMGGGGYGGGRGSFGGGRGILYEYNLNLRYKL